jgi:hypothetical protein
VPGQTRAHPAGPEGPTFHIEYRQAAAPKRRLPVVPAGTGSGA